jgi:hypothetical protein
MSASAFIPAENTLRMSEITINNETIAKVDALVRIDFYGFWYYTIFRRYNSPYDILVEDIHKNIVLLEKSSTATVRRIIAQLLNLSPVAANEINIANNHAMEQSCSSAEIAFTALDRPLLEIQRLYTGLYLNLEGVPPATIVDSTAVHTLLSLQIPESDPTEFYQAPSDSADLSMRVADVTARAHGIAEEISELMEEITSHATNYTLLRSGRRVYKA